MIKNFIPIEEILGKKNIENQREVYKIYDYVSS